MFKIGDKVVCISTDSSFTIEIGRIYTVKSILENLLTLSESEEPSFKYFQYRFKLVDNTSPFIEWEKAVGVNETCIP
jgi:hypothetical protein